MIHKNNDNNQCFDKCKNNTNIRKNEFKKIYPINKKKTEKDKNIIKHKMNIDNTSLLVNTVKFHQNVHKKEISKKNIKKIVDKKTTEIYTQNKDVINSMKEIPPKLPIMYSHDYNLENNTPMDKGSETLGNMNRDRVPVCFYNHLMICNNNKIVKYKNKYSKTSLTQRNKNKLLTIIYYSP